MTDLATAAPSPTPTAAPSPTPYPTEPPYGLSTFVRGFSAYASTTNYRPYAVKLRLYGDFGFLNIFFGYRGELPEGTIIRITELNGQAGNYGEAVTGPANLTETSADLLGAQIFSTQLTESVESARAVGIDPASGETLFELRLAAQSEIIRPNDTYVAPTPGPQASQTPQRSQTTPAQTPSPTPEASEIPADTILAQHSLEIVQKPIKYSHYNAKLFIYPQDVVIKPIFRYHDPLPEGTVLRVVEHNDTPGDFGSALVGPANLENASDDLLSAAISIGTLSDGKHTFVLEAIVPGTEEAIFTIELATESSVSSGGYYYYWGDNVWIGPGGTVVYPVATPTMPGFYNPYPELPEIDLFPGENIYPDTDWGFPFF